MRLSRLFLNVSLDLYFSLGGWGTDWHWPTCYTVDTYAAANLSHLKTSLMSSHPRLHRHLSGAQPCKFTSGPIKADMRKIEIEWGRMRPKKRKRKRERGRWEIDEIHFIAEGVTLAARHVCKWTHPTEGLRVNLLFIQLLKKPEFLSTTVSEYLQPREMISYPIWMGITSNKPRQRRASPG